MGCISSSTYCNPLHRHRSNRNHCDTQSQNGDSQTQETRRRPESNRSPSLSNLTSNSFQSNLSNQNSNTQFSVYVPPTGRNKRLKKDYAKYFKSDKKITESQLVAKREEFWDTAPAFEGKPEIWAALKAAVEALENKNFQLAQAIIDSASIILPNGLLSDCYDELGNRYQIPIYVLAKPSNLVKSDKTDSENSSQNFKKIKKKKSESSEEETSDDELRNKSKEKPGTSQGTELVQVKLRVSSLNQDTNNDLKFVVNLHEPVLILKQKLFESKAIVIKNQRLYFGGRLMRDKDKLKNYNLKKNVVIQVIVRDEPKEEICNEKV